MEDNATSTLVQLIKQMQVHVTKETTVSSLESHPDYPSLYSISSVLDLWNIDNAAFRINSVDQLYEIPVPFIAHTNHKGGWYKLITDIRGDKITYWDSEQGISQQNVSDFKSDFNNIVLIAEAKADSGEIVDKENRHYNFLNKIRVPVIYALIALVVLILSIHITNYYSSFNRVLFFTKLLGLIASIMLLLKQIGSKSNFLEKICRIKSKTNCDNLLNRPEAKIWGWLSWAEIGIIYFSGGLFATLIDVNNSLINWIAIIAPIYTIYSIYFQAFVAKIWCPLCIFVQAIIIIEFVFSIQIDKSLQTTTNLIHIFLTFSLSTALILAIKPIIESAQKANDNQKKLLYFSRKVSIFNTVLNEQPSLNKVPDNINNLIIGPEEATNVLTMVTNPYCRQCEERHNEIEKLLSISKNVKVRIIFLTSGAEVDKVTTLVQHLLAIEPEKFQNALHDWFNQKITNYNKWSIKYPLSRDINLYRNLALAHGLFCWGQGITASPILFLNNRRLPDVYEIKDLVWLLSEPENCTIELA